MKIETFREFTAASAVKDVRITNQRTRQNYRVTTNAQTLEKALFSNLNLTKS